MNIVSKMNYMRELMKLKCNRKQLTTRQCLNHDFLATVKHSTANKEILYIPCTAEKDTICSQKIWPPKYASKIQNESTQIIERSKTKEIVHRQNKQAYKYKP